MAMAPPQTTTQAAMALPWWRTRAVHPVTSEPSRAPAPGAAYSRPTTPAPPPYRWTASAGNTARGMPKIMALRSMR